MPEKFENAALFLRLGLPSTLTRHENGAFRKRSPNLKNLKTPALRFSVDTNPKWPVIVAQFEELSFFFYFLCERSTKRVIRRLHNSY